MPIWLFALGALGGMALISLRGLAGYLLAIVWGFAVFPHGAAYLWRRRRGSDAGGHSNAAGGEDVHYWRTTNWGSTTSR